MYRTTCLRTYLGNGGGYAECCIVDGACSGSECLDFVYMLKQRVDELIDID